MSKLNKLPVKNKVINQLAVGKSQTSIAKQVGVVQGTISRFAKKDDIRQKIEEEREKLVKVLPDAIEIVEQDLKNGKKIAFRYTYNRKSITSEDLQYKAQIQKFISDLFKMLGYFLHTNTSLHIGNLYQDNRVQTKITPEFDAFLDFLEQNDAEIPDTEAEYIENQKSKESIDSVNQAPS